MFEPRKLQVTYSVDLPNGETVKFLIRLDEHGLLEYLPDQGPPWTRMEGQRCPNCTDQDGACRAALAIAPVVDAFMNVDSLQQVRARAILANYTVEMNGSVARVVSSIMGLTMAAGGCPKIAPFRAMAMYHQPFATLEDTVIRAAGFLLLGRWAHATLADDNPFAPLVDAWKRLEEVNLRIGRCLRDCCAKDAALNGLTNLDMFAKVGGFALESALASLRPALLGWDLGLDSSSVAGPSPPAARRLS